MRDMVVIASIVPDRCMDRKIIYASVGAPADNARMHWNLWLAFIGASVAISVSPGAGAIQSMATGLTHGLRRGAWSVAGLQIGLMTQLAVVAIGLGAAVAKSVVAFTMIKWIGVLYLIYLAVRQWRTTADDLTERVAVDVDARSGRLALLLRGFLVNVTNPKGLVFLLAVLPQFVVISRPLLPQYLTIAATMVVVDVLVMCAYTGLASRLLAWLRTPRQQMILNRTMSGLFALAAVVLSLVRRGAAT
jgi:homoserine/homoserine lactone efflux protein